jgi:putative ABC transport system ATP-binding protein
MPHQVNNINRANAKAHILDIKAKYLKYVKIPTFKNSTKSKVYTLRLTYLEHKIKYLNLKISDIKSSFYNRYFAKRVKTLEKKKKEISSIENDGVINLVNVSKYYYNRSIATKVLNDVNLQIKSGEFVVIVGPSGSGKTTLLNIISGMDKATYGHVNVAGENLINFNNANLTKFRRKNIGYVFQQYALLSNLTVKENIEIGQHLQKDKSRIIDIDSLLKLLDIYEQRNKFPHELSGGQQQRVSIARSVAKNPIILFGDEPTGAVDEATSKNILDMFTKINKE